MEIVQYEAWIKVSQQKFVANLLMKFKMADCNAYKCPFLSGIKLGEVGDTPLVDCSLYRNLVESLLYLTHYRHDLAYDVGDVELYMRNHHDIHWK